MFMGLVLQNLEKGGIGSLDKINMAKQVTWRNAVNSQGGGYSGFQVTGMIEWSQKSRPKKILWASGKTPKNPWTKN